MAVPAGRSRLPARLGASVSPAHLHCSHGAEGRQLSKLGALLHKRMQGHRETGAKLTASVSTQDCMWRAAASTYHMAGKPQTGQSPSPLHSSSSLTKADVSLQTDSQDCRDQFPLLSLTPRLFGSPFSLVHLERLCIALNIRSE